MLKSKAPRHALRDGAGFDHSMPLPATVVVDLPLAVVDLPGGLLLGGLEQIGEGVLGLSGLLVAHRLEVLALTLGHLSHLFQGFATSPQRI